MIFLFPMPFLYNQFVCDELLQKPFLNVYFILICLIKNFVPPYAKLSHQLNIEVFDLQYTCTNKLQTSTSVTNHQTTNKFVFRVQ